MQMYRNFSLAEMTASDTARRMGISNNPPAEAVAHIGELCGTILQPLRDAWGKPIVVTSGYRCERLNKAVGGAATSAHCFGWAADLQPQDMRDFGKFANFVKSFLLTKGIRFDQLIEERSGSTRWLHIGIRNRNGEQRGQTFNMVV